MFFQPKTIVLYYNKMCMEVAVMFWAAKLGGVMRKRILCLIMLVASVTAFGGCKPEEKMETVDKDVKILKVNDTLYYGSDETGPMGDADAVEGYILDTVEAGNVPAENGVSNFGCVGNPYTYDFGDGWVMVFMEDEAYHIFYAEEP